MSGWVNVWVRIHAVPGFELVTVDVMRGDEIWVRTQVDGALTDTPEQELWRAIEPYWDAICDSNAEKGDG